MARRAGARRENDGAVFDKVTAGDAQYGRDRALRPLALVIATVGIYGVMAQFVARSRESACVWRSAPRSFRSFMVQRSALSLIVAGLLAEARPRGFKTTVASFLFGISPQIHGFCGSVGLLTVTALFATAFPAHRCVSIRWMRCDPNSGLSLRHALAVE